jgi:hypothetical protein
VQAFRFGGQEVKDIVLGYQPVMNGVKDFIQNNKVVICI